MQKKLLLLCLWVLGAVTAYAQVPDPCPTNTEPAADDCFSACIYCNFNGYVGQSTGYSQGSAPGFCGTIENEQWLGFIAGASSATFTATSFNCANSNGIQIALYETCGSSGPIACNGGSAGNANQPVSISTNAMIPGVNYYLMIDGYAGGECDFSINVSPPSAVIAQPLGPTGAIQGPATICPGGSAVYQIPVVANAGAYNWTVPPGWQVNGNDGAGTFNAPSGNVVTITAGLTNGSGQICVQPVNSCDQDNPFICRTVNVVPIPPTQMMPAVICNEDAPYTTPWGDDVFTSGTYQTTMTSYQGCDSVVRQLVTIKPPLFSTLPPQYICYPGTFTVCGEEISESGIQNISCQSVNGCDSTVNVFVQILQAEAEIVASGTLSCNNNSVTLTSVGMTQGSNISIYWQNLQTNQIISNQNSIVVTQPGTWVLNISANGGATQCKDTAHYQVLGNTTPPNLTASTVGVIGCTTTSVQLNSTTNATNPTYVWSGPGGFSASTANPTATQAGVYTVTVTSSSNGCASTATTTVSGNTTPPQASTTNTTLTCATTSSTISASSNVANPGFLWAGPGGFSSTQQMPTVTTSGTYTVTVTNPLNGCNSTATATVNLDNATPGGNANVNGVISCPTPSVSLNATTGATGATFNWAGPNSFSAAGQSVSANAAGTYTVTITGTNGCTTTANAQVTGDTNLPDAGASGGTVSCGVQNINLAGSSNTTGVTWGWTGPGSFVSNVQNPSVTLPGSYVLTVTASNGCIATAVADVAGDFTAPDASATGGIITCSQSSTTISASSMTSNVTYLWSGPGGYSSNQATNTVSTIGTYTVTVTSANGCTSTETAQVDPDAGVPSVSASGGTLNCLINSIVLNGGASPNTTLQWSGPGGFNSTDEDPTITLDGTYTLVATAPNGCTALATAFVDLDNAEPMATASGGTLTCADPNFTLQGDSPTSNVTWMWTGPGTFTSIEQNPTVQDAGPYTLVVTAQNGCTSSATTNILADQNAPVASSTTGILTCANPSLVLNASSTLPSTYQWSGPGGFNSVSQTPTVTLTGNYTVTVTAANGCTDAETILVDEDKVSPDLLTAGDTITCSATQVQIFANTTAGTSFQWAGPSGFNTVQQNPTVSLTGTYTVTVTGANGCTSANTAQVALNTGVPSLTAVAPVTLTCDVTTVGINATITANPASPVQTISWTGPGGFVSSVEDPMVTDDGVYTLTTTSENGCTTTTQVTVNQDITNPNADADGNTLTCTITSAQIDGISATTGASFGWTGPNGFVSNLEDPTVTADGLYTLTVTGPNGCTTTATATVILDAVLPGANAVSTNNLDCDDLTTTLMGSSPTGSVTYLWSGPGVSNPTAQNPTTDQPGTFLLTVTAQNGCTSTWSVDVSQNIMAPTCTATGDTIDCISGQAVLVGGSQTANVTYLWSGPNQFTSNQQNPTVTLDGTYTLVVTGLNACTASTTAIVAENTLSPDVTLAGAGTITCDVTSLDLTSVIATTGATGIWTLPNGQTSTQSNLTVSQDGVYTYTVTAPNGCISAPTLTVLENTQAPQAVIAAGGQIDCNFPTIEITSSTSTSGVSYAWSGPGGYTSSAQNPNDISNSGTYTVVITDLVNGCSSTATASVTQDPTVPDLAVQVDSLTCAATAVTLNTTTLTPSVTFLWNGPNGFTSTQEDPSVTEPGTYTLVATASSGCTSLFTSNVTQNVNLPGVSAQGDTITCFVTTANIVSNSQAQGATYLWSGPGGFTSASPSATVTATGNYTIVVTGTNGCTSSAVAVVTPDASIPSVSMTVGELTCAITSIQLTANSINTPQATWTWSGPGINASNQNQQNPIVTMPGAYSVTATAPNGCKNNTGDVVTADVAEPAVDLDEPDMLNCTTNQVGLAANITVPGTYTYVWSTQNGSILSGGTSSTPTVSQAGLYQVLVTNTDNGCISTSSVAVTVDDDTPQTIERDVRDVRCFGETNGAINLGAVTGGTPPYLYSLDNGPLTNTLVFTSLPPGIHDLLVQDAHGCELETTIEIDEPEPFTIDLGPDTTIHLGQTIAITLDDILSDVTRLDTTLVNPVSTPIDQEFQPLYSIRYQVTAVDTNGCKAVDSRDVIVDKSRLVYFPNVFDPTGNPENSVFRMYPSDYKDIKIVRSFLVFDRWGSSVHEYRNFFPDSPAHGWDGRIKGKEANPAVFVYYAEIEFIDGEVVLFKGDVAVIRN
ncbi:MAG: hypothetical protein IT269_08445 [Saprospiraceae bacterium]|nr:hypothetical protein [Saprospiraceae bacterium]